MLPGRQAAQQELIKPGKSIARIAVDTGFASGAHLTTCFEKYCDMPPSVWRRQAQAQKRVQ